MATEPGRAGDVVLGDVVIDVDGVADLLAKVLELETVRSLGDDLVGAMALVLSALRAAPVEVRMEAMGMVATKARVWVADKRTGWTTVIRNAYVEPDGEAYSPPRESR